MLPLLLTVVAALSACGGPTVSTPSGATLIPAPAPSEVESVLFLMGDAGDALPGRSPVLALMREDIEWWTSQLDRDSSIAVLVLGDIVYPRGLHPPGDGEYGRDSAVVMGQIDLVTGPSARERGARVWFMAGNHDWGLREDWEGYVRLRRFEEFVAAERSRTGVTAELVPVAGSGGPVVVDWGKNYRLLILDTAWWLLAGDAETRAAVLAAIDEAFATAGGRELLLAAHHPFRSGGPHGGSFSFWETMGIRYILFRSGAILQDISSRPYRELETGLREIFSRYGVPLAFIGGHEHSLQLLEAIKPTDPLFSIVSGSASKLSSVGPVDGLVFGQSAPGYMRLVIEKNGGVTLFVVAAAERFQHCPGEEPARTTCMEMARVEYGTVYSRRLK